MTRKDTEPMLDIAERVSLNTSLEYLKEQFSPIADKIENFDSTNLTFAGQKSLKQIQKDFKEVLAGSVDSKQVLPIGQRFYTFLHTETKPETKKDWLLDAKWRLPRETGSSGQLVAFRIRLKMLARNFFGVNSPYEADIDAVQFVAPPNSLRDYTNQDAMRDGTAALMGIIDVMLADLEINESKFFWGNPSEQGDEFGRRVEAYFVLFPDQEFKSLSTNEQTHVEQILYEWQDIIAAMSSQDKISPTQFEAVQREVERLRKLIPSSKKGQIYRGMAKVASMIWKVSKHPIILYYLFRLLFVPGHSILQPSPPSDLSLPPFSPPQSYTISQPDPPIDLSLPPLTPQ